MKKVLAAFVLAPAVAMAQQMTAQPSSDASGAQGKDTGTGQDKAQVQRSKKKAMKRAKGQKDQAAKNGERWDANSQSTSRVGPGSEHAKTGQAAEQAATGSTSGTGSSGGATSNSQSGTGQGSTSQSGSGGMQPSSTQSGVGSGTTAGSAGSAGGGSGR